ncbi:MFS transporter [Tricladium varicosporioides]|nr:MFS transporter [Hymenoscyphus varicosporioides]
MQTKVISANPLKLDFQSHAKCMAICLFATLSTFQYGLDYALIGGFLSMPGFLEVYGYYSPKLKAWNIDPTVQQLISSLLTLGTFIGSLMVGPLSTKFGRKHGLWAASTLNAIAVIIMISTTDLRAMYAARLILGIAVGWFFTFSQLYIHEAAPAHLRGVVFSVYQVMLACGSITGASIDFGTRDIIGKRAYQIPLCVCIIIPTIQSIALIFAPESPRWLMVQGRDTDAEKSLRKLRNNTIDEHQLQAELNEIRESTKEQLYQNKGYLFFEMWRGTNLRRSILSICAVSLHSANGFSWITNYTTYFLKVAGIAKPFEYTILLNSSGLIGVLLSFLFIRKLNRRTVLLWGCLLCGTCQLIPAIVWSVRGPGVVSGKMIVAFFCCFYFIYCIYAPQAYLVGGEIPNNQLRPFTYGIGTAVNFLGVWMGTFTAPYFINPAKLGWAAKYGYIWFGSNVVAVIFVLVFVPETRDRTLEEIHEMFEAKLKVSEFKSYVCVGVENFAIEGKAKADQILGEKELIA